jgi:DNA primase
MPRLPEELIDRIKDSSDIVEIVSEYVQLKKNGRNYVGLCPFHNENTPSFSVNPDLQIYKCFGCGVGGPVFKFIQEIDRVSFVEAVSFLAQRCGITLPERQADQEQSTALDPLYRANELAQKYFHHLLLHDEKGRNALDYIRSRRLADETVERFGLGYAPPGWDALIKLASNRQLQPGLLEKAGLASPGQRGPYDRFRDRLTFPIANLSGRTIAFGARALKPDQEPKYLNSPETPIYHKSAVLYGLNQTRDAIRKQGVALIVEGYMDLLSLVQQGIPHVVASAGTALTVEQCRTLARYAQQVVLIFDGDAAGSTAALRGIEVLLGLGLDARAVSLPDGHDPDTFVQEKGPEALLTAIETAGSALDFYLQQLARQWDLSTITGKAQAAEAIRPLLASCRDAVRRDLMLREMAQRLGIDEQAIRQELQQALKRQGPAARPRATDVPPAREDPPLREKQFLGLLLNFPRFIASTAQKLPADAFSDPRSQAIARILFEQCGDGGGLDLSLLMSGIEDEALVQLISACAMQGLDEDQVEQQWRDYLLRVQKDALTRRIDQARQDLQTAASATDESEVGRIRAALMALDKERRDLDS